VILLALLACSDPPPPPLVGAVVTAKFEMVGGGQTLECNARLMDTARVNQGADALVVEAPCNDGVQWDGLEAGEYTLVLQGWQVALTTHPVTLLADQHLDLGVIALEDGGALAVSVTREEGDPGGLPVSIDGLVYGHTDTQGVAQLLGAPVGTVEVQVKDGGFTAQAAVEVIAGQETSVLLELEKLPQRPVAGVRFKPVPQGVSITWTHPDGPAAGKLQVEDIVTAVEGTSLAGLTAAKAGPLMAGDTLGVARTYTVLRNGATLTVPIVPVGQRDLMEGEEEEE